MVQGCGAYCRVCGGAFSSRLSSSRINVVDGEIYIEILTLTYRYTPQQVFSTGEDYLRGYKKQKETLY